MTGNFALDSSCAASATAPAPPAGRSNSTIAGRLMSITWVQKSRGMLICAGADRRLAFEITRFSTSAMRDGIAHLLLIADHVAEQRHLLDFLEAALADGLVGGLRRHQQHRRVVPVGGLDRR